MVTCILGISSKPDIISLYLICTDMFFHSKLYFAALKIIRWHILYSADEKSAFVAQLTVLLVTVYTALSDHLPNTRLFFTKAYI